MRRPPYVRWAAAAAIVAAAFAIELSDRRTVTHPFLVTDVPAGQSITDEAVEWKPVPAGVLTVPPLDAPFAAHDLVAGEPLLASSVTAGGLVPPGWWSIPLTLPAAATYGSEVRLVVLSGRSFDAAPATVQASITGVVVEPGVSDAFTVADAGLVAVPPESADLVAVAAAEDRLMVLFGS